MARYSAFLGRRVEVHYRAGDVLLPASGTFVADSGRSIFLEQTLVQRGQQRHFRWEIPYRYIVRLEEKMEAEEDGHSGGTSETVANTEAKSPARAAISPSSNAPPLLPLPHPPKPA